MLLEKLYPFIIHCSLSVRNIITGKGHRDSVKELSLSRLSLSWSRTYNLVGFALYMSEVSTSYTPNTYFFSNFTLIFF